MKYSNLNLRTIEAIVNKLGGMDGVKCFLSGELTVKKKERECIFAVWKTIKLGTGLKTADNFRRALKAEGNIIGDWGASKILGRKEFTVAKEETEVDLVAVSIVDDLGFVNGATQKEIYEKAFKLGLKLCPAEVGPQLRLQFKNQPKGEWLLIGMEPIYDSDGDPYVFYVGRGRDGLWLDGYTGDPYDYCNSGDSCWVFVRPRK